MEPKKNLSEGERDPNTHLKTKRERGERASMRHSEKQPLGRRNREGEKWDRRR